MKAGLQAGRAAIAAILLAAALPARAALVNKVLRAEPSPLLAPEAAVPNELPESDQCAHADAAVYGLESSIYSAEAQYWAYLMRLPGYAQERRVEPGASLSHADLRWAFYRELALWSSLETVPELPAASIRRINDASARIRLVRDVCRL